MSEEKTILLIDDERALREIVRIALESQGYAVVEATNGAEGIEKLQAIEPDLIILDMNMPRMGGFEFYKSICGDDDKPPYPILVLTARAYMEKLFKELNIDGFIPKPFEIDQFLMEVNMIVQKKSKAQTKAASKKEKETNSLEICLVDTDPEALQRISAALTDAGYDVRAILSGVNAIEEISRHMPDAAVVSLKLSDIAGDIVINRLKSMAKTKGIKSILYLKEYADKTVVTHKISLKSDIDRFIDTDNPQDIVNAVNETLSIKKIGGGSQTGK